MTRSRKIIYSLLALPFMAAIVSLGMLDANTRGGFLADYTKTLKRICAGDWSFDELTEPERDERIPPRGRRGRSYGNDYNNATVSAKLDKDSDGKLTSLELGKHLSSILREKYRLDDEEGISLSQFEDSITRWVPPPEEPNDLATAVPVKLTAEYLLDPNRVIRVDVTVAEQDWEQLCNQSRNHQTAMQNPLAKPYTNFRASVVVDGVRIPDVAIRKKGFIGSQDTIRPSLKIKFDEYVEQNPVEGLDRLTLNNNKQDGALVSQALTYSLFRKAGVFAPRSSFAHVTVNGRYLGIYTHVESVKKPFLRHTFGDDTGSLYEGTLTDVYPASLSWMEAKTKESEENRQALTNLALILDTDSVTLGDIAERVDIDNYLTYWAIENLINFWDGYCQNQNNYFIYDNPANGLMYFMPWGADSCFGHRPHFVQRAGEHSESVRATGILANKLFHLPEIPEQYRQTMQRLLDEVWNEDELIAEMDRIETLLLDHLNFHQIYSIVRSDEVRRFIRNRRETITSELADWPQQVADGPRIPRHEVEIGVGSGSFQLASETDEHSVTGSMTIQDETIPFETIHVDQDSIHLAGTSSDDWPIELRLRKTNTGTTDSDTEIPVTGEFSNRQHGIEVTGIITPAATDSATQRWIAGTFKFNVTETRGGFMDRRR